MSTKIAILFLVVGIIGVSVAIGESVNYGKAVIEKNNIEKEYNDLKEKYDALNVSYNSLRSKHQSLQQKYDSLSWDYNNLQSKYNSLNSKYESLNNSYNNLQSSYDNLQSSYTSLQQDYSNLMNDYNSLVIEWNDLVSDWNELVSNWSIVMKSLGDRIGNDTRIFITPNDPDVISAKNSIISSDGILDWDDMSTINEWVYNNIHYNNDTFFDYKTGDFYGSFWMYPNETLEYKFGDCEEHATLMVSLCKAEQDVDWIWCAHTNLTDIEGTVGHAMVFISVEGDNLYIYDPTAGWNSSAAMPPQDALEEYCSVFGYNHIDVLEIYNEDITYRFNNNEEFYNWF